MSEGDDEFIERLYQLKREYHEILGSNDPVLAAVWENSARLLLSSSQRNQDDSMWSEGIFGMDIPDTNSILGTSVTSSIISLPKRRESTGRPSNSRRKHATEHSKLADEINHRINVLKAKRGVFHRTNYGTEDISKRLHGKSTGNARQTAGTRAVHSDGWLQNSKEHKQALLSALKRADERMSKIPSNDDANGSALLDPRSILFDKPPASRSGVSESNMHNQRSSSGSQDNADATLKTGRNSSTRTTLLNGTDIRTFKSRMSDWDNAPMSPLSISQLDSFADRLGFCG
jgi:hypothetical protein